MAHGRDLRGTLLDRALVPLLCGGGACLLVAGVALSVTAEPAAPDDLGSVPAASAPRAAGRAIYPTDRWSSTTTGGRNLTAGARPVAVRLAGRPEARVVPQSVAPSGQLGLPEDVGVIGWWSAGGLLGQPRGSAVLAGHVDGAGQGVGYFASLRTASVGDRVSVRGADGRVHQYAVTARRSYRKAALPASVFSPDVAHRLVLITCTGAFDPATRSYEDNLVVYAVPIPR